MGWGQSGPWEWQGEGKESTECNPGCRHHFPHMYPNTPGVVYQQSPSGATGRPEVALDTTQITR